MPSQQRFEGPDLEGLLADVRGRFGPDVAIVEANKIRKGGVGGFFARELFEVVVEVDDGRPLGAAGAEVAPAATQPRTLLDLVDAVDDGPAPDLPPGDGIATLLARVAEARAEAAAPLTAAAPAVSTDGDAFAAVLGRITRATQDPGPTPASDADEPFRSYADRASSAERPRPADRSTDARTRASVPAPTARRPRTPDAGRTVGHLDLATLARLGLPSPMLDGSVAADGRLGALLELAQRFPRAERLPTTGDTVIALVGDRSGMRRAVSWMHEQLGLPPERLMLATRSDSRVFPVARRIVDHEQAASQRRSWRRTTRPTLVVVDEPVAVRGTGWTRHVLDALEPAAVWAVVDAQRKPEDVVAWAERIGGVDAVALDGTATTASPAAILATGLPVGLIDGHAATPARWAAVLDERLLVA